MRLQRPVYVRKPVAEITLRVVARDLPSGAEVDVTDLQIQPGERTSGVAVNVREVGSRPGDHHYRNGVIHDDLEVIVMANTDRATPTRMEVLGADDDIRVGSYRFGTPANGRGWVDGRTHRANAGWGRPPVITQRSDLYLRTHLEGGRAHMRMQWRDRDE